MSGPTWLNMAVPTAGRPDLELERRQRSANTRPVKKAATPSSSAGTYCSPRAPGGQPRRSHTTASSLVITATLRIAPTTSSASTRVHGACPKINSLAMNPPVGTIEMAARWRERTPTDCRDRPTEPTQVRAERSGLGLSAPAAKNIPDVGRVREHVHERAGDPSHAEVALATMNPTGDGGERQRLLKLRSTKAGSNTANMVTSPKITMITRARRSRMFILVTVIRNEIPRISRARPARRSRSPA